jgi:hypothetical protein
MVNRQKIITMTKLALYDKHEGAADRDANDYFRHDYIYRKNLGTRISVGIEGVIILAIHWLRIIFVEGIDVFEINIQDHVLDSVLFIIALAAVYSVIGTIQGTREYYLVQKRLNRYQGMLRFLESAEERANAPTAPVADVIEKTERERRVKRDAPMDSLGGTPERERPERPERLERTERPDRRELPLTDRFAQPRDSRKNPDPLSHVSSRAMTTTRPRTTSPLSQRRPATKISELPPIRLTPPKKSD